MPRSGNKNLAVGFNPRHSEKTFSSPIATIDGRSMYKRASKIWTRIRKAAGKPVVRSYKKKTKQIHAGKERQSDTPLLDPPTPIKCRICSLHVSPRDYGGHLQLAHGVSTPNRTKLKKGRDITQKPVGGEASLKEILRITGQTGSLVACDRCGVLVDKNVLLMHSQRFCKSNKK